MPVMTCTFNRGGGPQIQMKLDLDENRPNEKSVLGWLQTGKLFEPDVANLFLNVLRQGDVVVDVGANIGFLTVLASVLVGPTGHVVAFEPGADNLERLRANLGHNDCKNVTVIEKAVTSQVGEVVFYINSDDSGGNALWDPSQFPGNVKSLANPMPIRMAGTTLDAEWERLRLPSPKVIKIDTEGAEQQVLEGARGLLAEQLVKQKPFFVVAELHPFALAKMGANEQSLRATVEGLGYSTFSLLYNGTLPRLVPAATRMDVRVIVNILFSTPDWVGEYWPTVVIDPRDSTT
jgi:FkbM family methyltransferase